MKKIIHYRNKYGNIKIDLQGIRFDSRKEARRYKELLLLEAAGAIRNLELQPRFLLQEGFRDPSDKWIFPIHCTWDFAYEEEGKKVVEDVKSPVTRCETAYVIRKKLFMKRYPDIEFREI